MAVNPDLPRLSEAELYSPDLDDSGTGSGELDVEHYQLPSGDEIEDPYLAEVWDESVRLFDEVQEDLDEGVVRQPSPLRNRSAEGAPSVDKSSPEESVLLAMSKIGQGPSKFTSIADLGRRLGGSPASLHAALSRLRQQGLITVTGREGRFETTPEEQRWLWHDGEETIEHVSIRQW